MGFRVMVIGFTVWGPKAYPQKGRTSRVDPILSTLSSLNSIDHKPLVRNS